jgi:hypothetical protein
MNAIGDRVKQIQKEARDTGGNIPFNKALAQAKSEASAPKPASDDDISFDFYHIVPEAGATAPESGTISGKADYTQSQIEHHQNAAKAADTAAAGMKSQAGKRAHQQLAEAHRTVAQTLKTPSMDKEAAAHFKSRAYANLETAKKGVKESMKSEAGKEAIAPASSEKSIAPPEKPPTQNSTVASGENGPRRMSLDEARKSADLLQKHAGFTRVNIRHKNDSPDSPLRIEAWIDNPRTGNKTYAESEEPINTPADAKAFFSKAKKQQSERDKTTHSMNRAMREFSFLSLAARELVTL